MSEPSDPFDLANYAPFYWTAIANRWTADSSRAYLTEFGIGVVEWRVLTTLDAQGRATSLEAARHAAIDTGASSRAMNELRRKGLATPVEGRFTGRSKPFEMTPAGAALFRKVSASARQRADAALGDLDDAERRTFIDLLRRVYTTTNRAD